MKRIAFIFVACLPLCALGADCDALCKKYSSPNPASKTMAQLERWVKNRVDNPKDAVVLKDCLVAGAADNPNQASYAGKGAI